MKEIRFEHVYKSYGKTEVVTDLNLTIQKGERLILLGPSGCGKSTTLRMIAGLEDVSSGAIYMDHQKVNHLPSGKRNVAMVFQNYALYPHMNVIDNITYGLRVQKVPADEIKRRTEAALDMLQLKEYKNRLPKDLSGGQRQRVALARAVVKQGDYFLLDEPLSNLDAQLRVAARKELVKIHEMYKQTLVYVTHDQVEAMTVADRIALMYKGKLQMVDTPDNVYHRPANIFTATFIGSPPMNVFNVDVQPDSIRFSSQTLKLSPEWSQHIQQTGEKDLAFGIRPEHIDLSKIPTPNSLKGQIKFVENHGNHYGVYMDIEGNEWIAMSESKRWLPHETVYIKPRADKIHMFNQQTTDSIGYPKSLNNGE
ncbi:ABC transporter ATP-binding protein [Pseudobacillus badius]|uniref:ABC transporter ATP-binding protein n=1 Tax=Bacillus badius TaxID=1455 RepID=UPI0007B0A818|nr:ABC transporter ATP-binding protein [Bacillus badius]KZO00159.1 sugar ABC transporter ATP-binding protein [Bacillus badius]OCS86321.1 sugar ABC transporter ATP-binding protein [Bacillus badius]OVE52219.1 ABC transporter ATP-binding protein [Bacillus badius]TDW03934.1 carbohydrate ABC transporter ATP-binding protein (CUT1 family) [Bacillus badius]